MIVICLIVTSSPLLLCRPVVSKYFLTSSAALYADCLLSLTICNLNAPAGGPTSCGVTDICAPPKLLKFPCKSLTNCGAVAFRSLYGIKSTNNCAFLTLPPPKYEPCKKLSPKTLPVILLAFRLISSACFIFVLGKKFMLTYRPSLSFVGGKILNVTF